MKKRVKKYIDKNEFVKLYLTDKDENSLTHFEGFIFAQSSKFILMCDFQDFNYDGFVVVRKSDVSEIKRTENEIFFDSIVEAEGIKNKLLEK